MRRGIVVLCGWIALCGGCDSNPVDPIVGNLHFAVGTTWIYDWRSEARDSLGNVMMSSDDSVEVKVAAVNDMVYGIPELIRLEARSLTPDPILWQGVSDTERVWYRMTSTELVEVAYQSPGAVPFIMPKLQRGSRSIMRRRFFDPLPFVQNVIASDSIQLREDPRIVTTFPLKPGVKWKSFSYPFEQLREVETVESIATAGRVFSAAKIRTTITDFFGPDDMWYDWVGKEGLLRRSILVKFLTTGEDPEVITGWMYHSEEATLVQVN